MYGFPFRLFIYFICFTQTANSQEELLRMVETQSEIIQKFKDECNIVKEKSLSNQQIQGYAIYLFF